MGTNFYLKKAAVPACSHCGRDEEPADEWLHIGKSSAGWCFALRVYPELNEDNARKLGISAINDLPDWIPLFERYGIVDEYGRDVSTQAMISKITERDHPRGLRRHAPSDSCRPGNGTYDLIVGEFS